MSVDIHPTAIVSPKAALGNNCSVGPFSIIYDGVVIGDNTHIEGYCEIGHPQQTLKDNIPLVIGANSLIRSHSVFYQGSTFGDGLATGHHVTVREKTQGGSHVSIGTLCDLQGYCELGDYVRFHSNVHIGQKSVIESCVWIFPYTVLTNDPHPPSYALRGVHVENYAIIATMSTILPGVRIGAEALIGAMSLINRDIPPGQIAFGVPAKVRGPVTKITDVDGKPVYPWFPNLKDRYPAEAEDLWNVYQQARAEQKKISKI